MREIKTGYLSRKDVCVRYQISRSSLYRRLREGKFPPPVKMAGSSRTLRWSSKDLEAFELDKCEVSLGEPTDIPSHSPLVAIESESGEIAPPKILALSADYSDSSSETTRHGFEHLGLLGFSTSLLEAPKRLLNCLRHPVGRDVKPTLHYFKQTAGSVSISFRGLRRCELWACPVCAPAKAKAVRGRLDQRLIELRAKGCNLFFVTFTFGHNLADALCDVYGDLIDIWSRLVVHPDYKSLLRMYGFQIHFWVRELKYGLSGWHPHVHAIVEFSGDSSLLQEKLTTLWGEVCKQKNRAVNRDRGVCVSGLRADASAYLLKQWSESKSGNDSVSLTPLQLGYSAFRTGDQTHEMRYREYLQFSKSLGRHKQFFLSGKCEEGEAGTLPVINDGMASILHLNRVNLIEIRERGVHEFVRRQNFI